MKRVVVGLSGGVDSSVAAWLLKEQGYEVIGLFMKNWHDESVTLDSDCPWWEDSNDALMVAEKLGIPYQTIDLSAQYQKRIVDYMFSEYEQGRTPNPDVLCNREIKFDIFLKTALNLGADFVATGHYCRKEIIEVNGKPTYRLLAGKDNNKDQSYFLCQVTQNQLSKALFPIGELTKPEVREIATKLGLVTANKKDSQGLCFIGKVKLPDFLKQQLHPIEGDIIEVDANAPIYSHAKALVSESPENFSLQELSTASQYSAADGKVVGKHQGAHYFTIGQRKGLDVGGTPLPLFVIATDTKRNLIYTGQGQDHPGLLRKGLFIKTEDIHWVRPDLALEIGDQRRFESRIRYRQSLEMATLYREVEGLYIIFDDLQRGVAAGQFASWYLEDELIGSGAIA